MINCIKTSATAAMVAFALGCSVLFSLTSELAAQPKTSDVPPAPAAGAEPETTTATFGDWVLTCSRYTFENQKQRTCEVSQTILVRGQQAPIAKIAVGRLKKGYPLTVTLVLPINVSFPSAPQVSLEGQPALKLSWKNCLPNGCFADSPAKDEVLTGWRAAKANGKIESKDAFGRDIAVTLSFRGIAQALDAMAKEPL